MLGCHQTARSCICAELTTRVLHIPCVAKGSSRIYPEGDDVAWGLAVWSNPPSLAVDRSGGGAWDVVMNATVWEMQNAWLPPNC
jgi:hypothetical protein